jgi:hypothetical protein
MVYCLALFIIVWCLLSTMLFGGFLYFCVWCLHRNSLTIRDIDVREIGVNINKGLTAKLMGLKKNQFEPSKFELPKFDCNCIHVLMFPVDLVH